MSREQNVRLMMKAYQCSQERAEQICAEIESGKRKVASNEALLKRAGAPSRAVEITVIERCARPRPRGRLAFKSHTRPLGRPGHMPHPAHPEGGQNGDKEGE
jgi:hypothetical protein